jgi:predicted N-acetyltransferase YhbS
VIGNARRILVRHEQPGDEAGIRRVTDDAFGGPDESRIVEAARAGGKIALSLVAVTFCSRRSRLSRRGG